jgi:hypothetical protein
VAYGKDQVKKTIKFKWLIGKFHFPKFFIFFIWIDHFKDTIFILKIHLIENSIS